MRKITRDEALALGVKPKTWEQFESLPKGNPDKRVITQILNLLRRVDRIEKKHGPIRFF